MTTITCTSPIHVSTFFNSWGPGNNFDRQLLYVDPVDDAPPVTVITDWQWMDEGLLRVSGVAVDNGEVKSVRVNGTPAILLQRSPLCEWTQVIPARGQTADILAEAEDEKGNLERTLHHLKLSRDANGLETVVQESFGPDHPAPPMPANTVATSPAVRMTSEVPTAEIREVKTDTSTLRWPLWNGKETVADYAARTHIAPMTTLDLGGRKLEMVLVPAGSFLMGSAPGEEGAQADERPQHRVVISRPFYLGKYKVTQAQYASVTSNSPSYFHGDDLPVEQVSWGDAQAFLQKAGHGLRLPKEAEWEFACRAGTATAYYSGNDEAALSAAGWWGHGSQPFRGNSSFGTSPVGRKIPNAFGLYDMHGTVYEWCTDIYAPDYYRNSPALDPTGPSAGEDRVLRGGSWEGEAGMCRSANRNAFNAKSHGYLVGFRVVMPVAEP